MLKKSSIATISSLAESAKDHDDLPPVLFTGSGSGYKQTGRAEGALDAFLNNAKADGRVVVFDKLSLQEGAVDDAISLSSFNTACLLDKRQICVLRRIDNLPSGQIPRLKRLINSGGKWWIMSASSPSKVRSLTGFFMNIRISKKEAGKIARGQSNDSSEQSLQRSFQRMTVSPAASSVPKISKVSDVSVAVASGATIPELIEAFKKHAMATIPPHDAIRITAQLDVDLRTNKRPLMLSTLLEDAVRDVDDVRQSQ